MWTSRVCGPACFGIRMRISGLRALLATAKGQGLLRTENEMRLIAIIPALLNNLQTPTVAHDTAKPDTYVWAR